MVKNGRNAPCPCGSGKKYKMCCLEKDKVHTAAAIPAAGTATAPTAAGAATPAAPAAAPLVGSATGRAPSPPPPPALDAMESPPRTLRAGLPAYTLARLAEKTGRRPAPAALHAKTRSARAGAHRHTFHTWTPSRLAAHRPVAAVDCHPPPRSRVLRHPHAPATMLIDADRRRSPSGIP